MMEGTYQTYVGPPHGKLTPGKQYYVKFTNDRAFPCKVLLETTKDSTFNKLWIGLTEEQFVFAFVGPRSWWV